MPEDVFLDQNVAHSMMNLNFDSLDPCVQSS